MRLSEYLRKGIIETTVGGIINKFEIKKRRNVLFFEDILANYIKECEDAGYETEIMNVGQQWMNLGVQEVVPEIFKKTPNFFLNNVMKRVWINLGLMDDFHITKKDDIIVIKTKNEALTRIIGKNECLIGFYAGILNTLFNSQVECVNVFQTKEFCNYVYKIEDDFFGTINAKEKEVYDELNHSPELKGITLKDALKAKIFRLKSNNRLYFRGKSLWYVENTVFHILSNRGILLDRVSFISYNYFKQIIKKSSSNTEKLTLLKTLLQSMGWGTVTIINRKKKIILEINCIPYGLQPERDNWTLLINVVCGYLWLINKELKVEDIKESYKKLVVTYSS